MMKIIRCNREVMIRANVINGFQTYIIFHATTPFISFNVHLYVAPSVVTRTEKIKPQKKWKWWQNVSPNKFNNVPCSLKNSHFLNYSLEYLQLSSFFFWLQNFLRSLTKCYKNFNNHKFIALPAGTLKFNSILSWIWDGGSELNHNHIVRRRVLKNV